MGGLWSEATAGWGGGGEPCCRGPSGGQSREQRGARGGRGPRGAPRLWVSSVGWAGRGREGGREVSALLSPEVGGAETTCPRAAARLFRALGVRHLHCVGADSEVGQEGEGGFWLCPPRSGDVTARPCSEARPPRRDRAGGIACVQTPVCRGTSTAAPVRRGRGVGPVSSLHRGLPWGGGLQGAHPTRARPRCSLGGSLARAAAEWPVCQAIAHQPDHCPPGPPQSSRTPRVLREACVQS